MKVQMTALIILLGASLAPAARAEPRAVSSVLKRMDRAGHHRILPRGKQSWYGHSVAQARLSHGKRLSVLWKPRGHTEIQVTKPQGGWVRREVVMSNPIKRALYNAKSKVRAWEVRKGYRWNTGGPPVDRAVSYKQAARTLATGLDGARLQQGFDSMLGKVTRKGNPFGYQQAK